MVVVFLLGLPYFGACLIRFLLLASALSVGVFFFFLVSFLLLLPLVTSIGPRRDGS